MAEEKRIVKREVKKKKIKKSKKKRFFKFLMFLIVVAGIVCFLLFFPSCGFYDRLTKGFTTRYEFSDQYTASNSYEANGYLDRLNVNWVYGTVTIKTHDEDKISIIETPNQTITEKFMMHYNYNDTDKYGNSMQIQYSKTGKHNFGNLKKDLTILIPKRENIYLSVDSWEADINIDMSDSNISTLYILANNSSVDAKIGNANEVNLTGTKKKDLGTSYHYNFTSTGVINSLRQTNLVECNLVLNEVHDLTAGSVYKDISVFANKVDKAKIENSRGNIKATLLEFNKVTMETNSGGNINIYLKEDVNATITATIKEHYDTKYMGSFNSELGEKTNDTVKIGSGEKPIAIKAVGDVNIYKYEE